MSNERTTPIRLLLVDDDETLIETMARRFERKGMDVAAARTAGQALDLAAERRFDVALVDLNLPDMSGVELLAKLKEHQPELEALMLTGHGSMESAVAAMKAGAYDYLTKPFHFSELEVHIQKAYDKVRLARRERQWVEHVGFESPRYKLVGSSPQQQQIIRMIEKVAPSDATVLIRGASGTGKELVARAVHYNSPRCSRPLASPDRERQRAHCC